MFYDAEAVLKPTKKDILDLVSEYDILTHHLGFTPRVGSLYISPLRKDSNPSFGIFRARNGNLLFKDLGTGESGNCFKLVCLLENISSRNIYEYLYKQYTKTKRSKPKAVKVKEIPKGRTEIVVEKMPFTKKGLKFWSDLGVTEATLNHFKISEIRRFWVNGRMCGYASEKYPMFNYDVYDHNKIYRPYNKEKRFFTNCSMFDIQGWEQLDYTKDMVIITKSLKDLAYLYELGYTAIAPNGEGHAIPKKALDHLRKNFKYIIVFYDKDVAGITNTRKLIKANSDFGFIFTPDRTAKDITDHHTKHGKDATVTFISKKLDYARKHHFKHQS